MSSPEALPPETAVSGYPPQRRNSQLLAVNRPGTLLSRALVLIFSLSGTLLPQPADAVQPCGSLKNPYGPFDYTNPTDFTEKLGIVENRHFTFDVEALKKGGSTGSLARDLDYTLRAFPNHHRALYAMARYQLLAKGKGDARYTIECYFDRAIRLNQDDGVVWMLHGIYLHKKHDYKEALDKYERALELIPRDETADLHYNMGLLFVDMKQYARANEHAQLAYELKYPLPGLRNRLKKLGYWQPRNQPTAADVGAAPGNIKSDTR